MLTDNFSPPREKYFFLQTSHQDVSQAEGLCLPCSLNEENRGRFHVECQEARMPFVDLRKYNTKVPVWLTQWVTGTPRYCRQCRCCSSIQEHPYKHLSKTVPFLSMAAAASRSYMFSGSPPIPLRGPGRWNACDPPSAPHHTLLWHRGSLKSSNRCQLSG